METKATLCDVFRDIMGGGYKVTFHLDFLPSDLQGLGGKVLRLIAKEWKERRSLDANAYCWKLCSLIAEEVRSSKDEVYEEMIQRYGYLDDIPVTVKADVDMSRIPGHWHLLRSNGKWSAYVRIRGSSEYDSKEMAHFLDGIVDEAQALGIETRTPDEIERMKQEWKVA